MEALRDLADDFNVRDPRKLYRLARQRDLDVTQAMAFEALKADVGRQVQAPRPRALGKSAAEGPNDRLQADLIELSQNTWGKTKYGLVVMDVFTREAAVEPLQNKNAETVGRATKRAAWELTGDDGNFVVTTDLGNEFATLDRELPEAVCPTGLEGFSDFVSVVRPTGLEGFSDFVSVAQRVWRGSDFFFSSSPNRSGDRDPETPSQPRACLRQSWERG